MHKIQLSIREKRLFYLCLAIVGLFLMYSAVRYSILDRWNELTGSVLQKELKLTKAMQVLSQKEAIEKNYRQYAQAGTNSEEAEVAFVLKEVEKIANSNKVKTTNMKAKPVKEEGLCRQITIDVECEASISALAAFMYAIHQSPQILRIKSLRINTGGSQETMVQVSMLITKILIA